MFNIPLLAVYATLATAPSQIVEPTMPSEAEVRAVVSWAKKTAIPIKTVEAESGFEDLQRVKDIVGNARIVGMGEATHGTHESSVMKHRMFEFLVKEKGFNIFGLECTYSDCLPINEYVLTGQGDPQELLRKQGYWTWNTEEMLDLIQWMRHYNEDPKHKRKLKFYGFDMQYPDIQAKAALEYLHRAKPELADTLRAKLKLLISDAGTFTNSNYLGASSAERAATKESLKELLRSYDENKKELVEKLGPKSFREGRQAALMATQGEADITLHLSPRSITKDEIALANRCEASLAQVKALKMKMPSELGQRVDRLTAKVKDSYRTSFAYYTQFTEQERAEWKQTAEMLKTSKDMLTQGLSPEEAAKASQAIEDVGALLSYLDVFALPHPENWREICMAQNISWILETEGPDSKIMTWSHNLHASKAIRPYDLAPYRWMGNYLADQWGKSYVAVGFSIFSGSLQAYYAPPKDLKIGAGVKGLYFKNSPTGSIDHTFSLVGYPLFLIETRQSNDAEVQKWLDTKLQTRSVGATFDPSEDGRFFDKAALAKTFDAVIFIRDTTRAIPTPLARKLYKLTDLTPINPKPRSH